jgi:hypothetical protein
MTIPPAASVKYSNMGKRIFKMKSELFDQQSEVTEGLAESTEEEP